jgi:hypothetical protein
MLSPPNLTAHASNRVCNALALLQCVASHQETRRLFLEGEHVIPHPSLCAASLRSLNLPLLSVLIFFSSSSSSSSRSTHPAVPLPVLEHGQQKSSVRVPEAYKPWGYWRFGQGGWLFVGVGSLAPIHGCCASALHSSTTRRLSTFSCRLKSYRYACASWKRAVSCRKRYGLMAGFAGDSTRHLCA